MIALKIEQIVAGYDGSDILKGVNLFVEQGSVTCVIGPNGAGKSTLLRVVSGLLKPRLGTVTFLDHSLIGKKPREILAQGIVQVPQSHSLFPEMTVRENVRLGGYTLRDRTHIQRRLSQVEDLFPLVKERANDKAGALSGGQQRLIEFARSLMLDPALILLDEPSMGLDPKTLKQVLDTVKIIHDMKKTILLVEQNVRTALKISTYGVVMESGKVLFEGSSDQILQNPQIGHLYLGGTVTTM